MTLFPSCTLNFRGCSHMRACSYCCLLPQWKRQQRPFACIRPIKRLKDAQTQIQLAPACCVPLPQQQHWSLQHWSSDLCCLTLPQQACSALRPLLDSHFELGPRQKCWGLQLMTQLSQMMTQVQMEAAGLAAGVQSHVGQYEGERPWAHWG